MSALARPSILVQVVFKIYCYYSVSRRDILPTIASIPYAGAATMIAGAGEDSAGGAEGARELPTAWLGALAISTSIPLLLFSLSSWLLSLFSLLLSPDAGSSDLGSGLGLGGAVQRGTSQTTPVKLLSLKPPLFHLRQGLPDRSRALKPAFMAP